MRTLEQCCREGIRDIHELREALQLAMRLEFATIPPYLCAQWSVRVDPDRTEGVIHHIVGQEMNHLALAGNLLVAIGGLPQIAQPDFLPRYPLTELPGGIDQEMPVDLRPFTYEQVQVFMQIEHPTPSPCLSREPGSDPATIGEFYETIISAFEALKPKIRQDSHQVPVALSDPICTIADAVSATTRIMEEGEGCSGSPQQPTTDGHRFAHYYLFREIYMQRRLVETKEG